MKRLMTVVIIMMTMITSIMAKDMFSPRGVKFLKSRGYEFTTKKNDNNVELQISKELASVTYKTYKTKRKANTEFEKSSDSFATGCTEVLEWNEDSRLFNFTTDFMVFDIVLKVEEKTTELFWIEGKTGILKDVEIAKKM